METNYKEKRVLLPDGTEIPKLGQGTWRMGEDDENRQREVAGLKYGLDIGISLIDTAEMYSDGKAEAISGDAIKGRRRQDIYIVDKVYPKNADRHHMFSSCDRSLKLLGTDYIDMYLLHWREDADLTEVVYCMEMLKEQGRIKRWGVSNFDVSDMEDLFKVPDGSRCQINQILYNLASRGIEYDLLSWQRERGIPFMAYSPVGQAGSLITQDGISKAMIMEDETVKRIAREKQISVVQLLLAFVMRFSDMVAIPKAVGCSHIDENAAAADIALTDEELEELSNTFPAPKGKIPMEKY